MARSAEDLEALRIFADPTIDPIEKQRLLAMPYAPPAPDLGPDQRVALNDGAGGTTGAPESLPDVPSGPIAAGSGGTSGTTPPPDAQNSGAEGAAPAAPAPPRVDPAAEKPTDGVPVSLDEGDAPDVAPVSADDYRGALNRATLLLGQPGGRSVPTERVTEQMSARSGVLSPGQRAEHSEALSEHEQATADLAALEAEQAQQQRDIEVQRRQDEMAERDRLARVRAEEVARAQEVEAQRQRVSQELLDVDVKDENLFAGQDFGERLLTFVGMLALGAGLGATGNADKIIPTVQALARRETDKQRRFTELKQGQLSTLGTMYERHYQNLQNAELASKATQADILARYELELAKYGREMGPAIDQAALAQKIAAIRTARVEAEAQRDKAFGDQVETQVQRAFVRPLVTPKPVAAAAAGLTTAPAQAGKQKPRLQDYSTEREYFEALADYEDTDAPLDPAVAEATGQKPAAPAAKPAAVPAKATAKGPTVTAGLTSEREQPKESAAQDPRALVRAGRPDLALAALPDRERALVRELFKKRKAERPGATDADALSAALGDLGYQGPESAALIPEWARSRAVRDVDGKTLYAIGDNPLEVKKQFTAHNQLVSAFRSLLSLAKKPKAKWSPEDRANLETQASLIAPQIAVALGQGAMATEEQKLYSPPAGADINGLTDWLLGTGQAKAEAGLRSFQNRRRVLLRDNFSRSPTGESQVGP